MANPAVVFDLDGTLVDSEPLYHEAGRRTLAGHGVTDYTWERHLRFVGVGTEETLEVLREEHGIAEPTSGLLAAMDRHYLELARERSVVLPGAERLARTLRAAGNRLALASGSSVAAIDAVLAGTGLAELFEVTVSAQEVARGKPEPDVLLEAARRLGVEPADCVVVEDSPPGALAAARAGMRCVAVPSVPQQADDPAFATAGLVFAGGHREFDPRVALDWING